MQNRNLKKTLLAKQALVHFKNFLNMEANSGIILLIFTAIALILANSPLLANYQDFLHTVFSVQILEFKFSTSLHFLINEVLMTLFFLVVGLEIRYEIYNGSLSSIRQALLPIIAAIGGVMVPALIFLSFNNDPLLLRGWAIPTATDIAFAVGVLSLLKRFIPNNLKVFLLTLAIIDDIIAIIIIAIFYSQGINFKGLLIAGLGITLMHALCTYKINFVYVYVVPGVIIWGGLFAANIHPTLAGVIFGLMLPVDSKQTNLLKDRKLSLGVKLQKILHPWVAYLIMPLFALANAGISINEVNFLADESRLLIISLILALVIGKPLGIISMSILAVQTGLCKLPQNIEWNHIILVGLLAGIGFTMSIFIAMLGFDTSNDLLNASKFAVLIGSFIASILGLWWGIIFVRKLR